MKTKVTKVIKGKNKFVKPVIIVAGVATVGAVVMYNKIRFDKEVKNTDLVKEKLDNYMEEIRDAVCTYTLESLSENPCEKTKKRMEKDIIRKTRRYNNYLIAVSGRAITAANKFDVLPTDVNSISKRFVVIN